MACIETFAALRIFSENISPSEISTELGIEPTKAVAIDPKSKYKVRRETNYWSWETEGQLDSTENHLHLEAIANELSGKEKQLQNLRDRGCQTDIFCYWVGNGQGGPILNVDLMELLYKLGLPVLWDNYFEESET